QPVEHLRQHSAAEVSEADGRPAAKTDAGVRLFDESVLLDRVGGDVEVAVELASAFLEESPRLLAAVREAMQSKNPIALNRAAHALKGSVANFGVNGAVETALELEQLGASGQLRGAAGLLAHLESQILTVTARLKAFLETRDLARTKR